MKHSPKFLLFCSLMFYDGRIMMDSRRIMGYDFVFCMAFKDGLECLVFGNGNGNGHGKMGNTRVLHAWALGWIF